MTHNFKTIWSSDTGDGLQGDQDIVADGEFSADVAVGIGSQNIEVAFAVDLDNLKGLFVLSDQDVTLETNSGTTAVDTIALAAGEPLVWKEGDPALFSQDITSLFLSNSGAAAATVKIRALIDVTP